MARCYDNDHEAYMNYGGRGIGVCLDWYTNIVTFIEWGIQNGWQPGLKMDRRDNDSHYSPDNCRFITTTENNRNKRNSRYLEYQGVKKTMVEWAEERGLKYNTLFDRIKKGWDIAKALESPSDQKYNPHK